MNNPPTVRLLYNEFVEAAKKIDKLELVTEFDNIYRASLDIWKAERLEQFTTHGKEHTEQVEQNLDDLTRSLQNSETPLTVEEIFVLLSACCLHDIGMQIDDPNARAKHAEYSYKLIAKSSRLINHPPSEKFVTLPISDTNARLAIACVAKAHWVDYALPISPSIQEIYGNKEGRLRLLGLLLAMADLLDISPIRARYFRSSHRLYDLGSLSELHNRMHDFVRGCKILNDDASRELSFRLRWRDDSEPTHDMCDWNMKWFDSQWRKINQALKEESGGTIRWAEPWAFVEYRPAPEEPIDPLSLKAIEVLRAERVEQVRINREKFIKRFQKSLGTREKTLFLVPANSDSDGDMITDWCYAHLRVYKDKHLEIDKNLKLARVDLRRLLPATISGIISEITEQWQIHLPQCESDEALAELQLRMRTTRDMSFVSIIVSDVYRRDILGELLKALMLRPEASPRMSRICILQTDGAIGPSRLGDAAIFSLDNSPFSQPDVERHLQNRLGYNENESQKKYKLLAQLPNAQQPPAMYTFVEKLCWFSSCDEL